LWIGAFERFDLTRSGVVAGIEKGRQIARAYVRRERRLGNMNRRAFCEFMKEGGYDVSLDDLKNAGKPTAKLIQHAI
jgi:hypothetical protein